MLLTSLTPDELERLAFLQPAHPGVAAALCQVAFRELATARDEIAQLEESAAALQDRIDALAAEVPE